MLPGVDEISKGGMSIRARVVLGAWSGWGWATESLCAGVGGGRWISRTRPDFAEIAADSSPPPVFQLASTRGTLSLLVSGYPNAARGIGDQHTQSA